MFAKTECMKIKLCPCSLGVALGVGEGLFMLLFAWAGHLWHYGTPLIHEIATVYYGYAPTIVGGLYGGLWGFFDGFIFGIIIGLVYNFCISCCCAKSSINDSKK